jgi:hypothetical protein
MDRYNEEKYRNRVLGYDEPEYPKDIADDLRMIQGRLKRAAQNFPIQSISANMTKIAMSMMYDWILKEGHENDIRIVLALHDEIVLECKTEVADIANKKLGFFMENAGTYFCKSLPEKKKQELKISSTKKAYLLGQKRSMFTEALTLGYTPLVLIVSNIFIALGTAAFVAWLLHHMPWAFPKMALFAVVGAVAAIYIASRGSFAFQIIGLMRKLPAYAKKADLSKDYVKWTKQKMRLSIFLNLALVIVGLALVASVHTTLILIMFAAFQDPILMKDLGIQGGEFAYIVLGIGMEVASALVDIFLGLNTRIRVNVEEFLPDLEEIDTILQKKEDYLILESRIEALTKVKETKKETKSKVNNENKQENKNNENTQKQRVIKLNKPDGPLEDISGFNKNEDIFKRVFQGTNFVTEKFEKALAETSDATRRKKISKAIAGEVAKIKNLYAQGSNEDNWNQNGDTIWRDIEKSAKKIGHISKSIGYEINMKK